MIKRILTSTRIILLFLLGAGLFLRVYQLNQQSYWMDEGYTVNAVISQVENGTKGFAAVLDSGKTYFCPVYCYPTALISQVFGQQPASYRILSALFGVFFILVAYFFTKELFKKQSAALLAALFVTFSYWQIAWSRQARWYTLLETFFWLAILFFYRFLKSETRQTKIIFLVLTLLSTLLAIAAQGIAYLLPILFFCWYLFEKRPPIKYVLPLIAATSLVLLIAEYGFQLAFVRQALQQSTLNNHLWYYISFYSRTYWPILLIVLYGLIRANKENRKLFLILLSPFVIYLLTISLFTEIVHYRYLFHTTFALFVIAAVTLIDSLDRIRKPVIRHGILVASISLFFLTGQGILFPKDFYSLEADDPTQLARAYYAYTPQPEFTGAYEFIRSKIKDTDLIISTQPQFNKIFLGRAGYWLAYDYLGSDRLDAATTGESERYVNAKVLHSLEDISRIMEKSHGYIVIDSMATDGRLPEETIRYIQSHSGRVFYDQRHSYSQIWVYQF